MRAQGYAEIELNAGITCDERVGARARVTSRVGDEPRALLQDARRAQAKVTFDVLDTDAVTRLEPNAVVVDDADDGDWSVEQPCC